MATVRHGVQRESLDDHRGHIFPAMGIFISSGLVLGITTSVLIGELLGHGGGSRLVPGALSAGLGAILGLFVGLSRGVWHSGPTPRLRQPVSAPDQLWDPWLDCGRDVEERRPEAALWAGQEEPSALVETVGSFPAEQARVRPRVISPVTGEAIPLENEIGAIIQEGRRKLVRIVGGAGSGKTTALRHLAAVLPPWAMAQVRLVDDVQGHAEIVALFKKDSKFVISVGGVLPQAPHQVTYTLASWSRDDAIEYLLSAHWDRCASVMARLKVSDDRGFLKGIPELWTVVLDRMARDESIADVRSAIRCELAEWFTKHPGARSIIENFCLTGVGNNDNPVLNFPLSALSHAMPKPEQHASDLLRLVRHRPVGLLLAADRIKDIAERGAGGIGFCLAVPP